MIDSFVDSRILLLVRILRLSLSFTLLRTVGIGDCRSYIDGLFAIGKLGDLFSCLDDWLWLGFGDNSNGRRLGSRLGSRSWLLLNDWGA